MNKFSLFRFDFTSISDGLKMSLPSLFYENKLESVGNYGKIFMLQQVGLPTNVDYTDTIFSMGTEVASIIGFVVLFPLIIAILEILDRYLTKKEFFGIFTKIITYKFFVRIENEWISFIPSIRDTIIVYIIALVLYKIFIRYKYIKDTKVASRK